MCCLHGEKNVICLLVSKALSVLSPQG
uniref:Uncharacterized protein n=1 Tax=Anguilla anguilla TaxID=7936 RepID=A0A0E9RTJ2_ANGAN